MDKTNLQFYRGLKGFLSSEKSKADKIGHCQLIAYYANQRAIVEMQTNGTNSPKLKELNQRARIAEKALTKAWLLPPDGSKVEQVADWI